MKVIIEYQTKDNRNYFREWFNQLTKVNQIKVHKRLDRIANGNYGNTANEGSGIIAIIFRKEGLRIYISNVNNTLVIILCVGDKKSSKSEQSNDIKHAKILLEDYRSRL